MTLASCRVRAGCRLWWLVVLALGSWLLQAHTLAHCAEMIWKARHLELVANEKPLSDFLRELVASQGLTAVVDTKISGVISGKFVLGGMGAKTILDNICTTYGLTWYYDGAFFYIDPANEALSEVLALPRGGARNVVQMLSRMKIMDSRFQVVASELDDGLLVTGPKRYVDIVRQALRLVNQRTHSVDQTEVRLFPLKSSWAGDVRVNRGGKDTNVPGVVSVLRSLYGRKEQPSNTSARSASNTPSPGVTMRQLRLASGETVTAPKLELGLGSGAGVAPSGDDNAMSAWAPDDGRPQFHADPRMNAVWVRDLPDRMARYEVLIAAMDKRPQLIEIEVTIMDISSDNFDALGVDWRLHGRRADAQTGNAANPSLTWSNASTESGQTSLNTPAGGVFTAAIGNSLRNFLLARISALTKTGAASVVARPKVLTLNNTEALLENLSQLNVRVSGFQDAGLFTITAGTSLRMTPLIVEDTAQRSVMMSIEIVDGDLSPVSVDQIPIIRRRSINTQAMVDESASLLIAGFSSVETINAVTGVPLVSQLPLIGNLFKHTENTRTSMERLYLLTPRLVMPPAASTDLGD